MGSGTLTNGNSNSGNYTYGGVISGSGNLIHLSRILTLTGNNTYTGTTTIASGNQAAIQVGIGGTSGSIGSGNVINNGSLTWNRSDNITIANNISGSGSVTKSGAGMLTLTSANTYSGITAINNGILQMGTNNAIGSGSNVILADTAGAGLDLNNYNLQVYTFSGGGTNGGNIALGSGTLITGNDGSGDHTYGGVISGSGGITKESVRTLILTGDNTYTGTTTINGGTLRIGTANERISDSSTISVASGATFDLAGFSETVGSITSTGNITLGSGTLTSGGNNSSTTFSGVISGTNGSITKTGAGTLTLTGANTYTGATTISAGTLQVGSGGTSGSLGNSTVTVSSGGALVFNRSDDISVSNFITGAGTLTQAGPGVLTPTNGSNNYTGQTFINNGTISISSISNGGNASPIGAAPSTTPISIGSALTAGTLLYTGAGNNIQTDRQIIIGGAAGGTFATAFNWDSPGFTAQLILNGTINGNGHPLTLDINRGISSGGGLLTINGQISGAGTYLTKIGDANLNLVNGNTYSGGTNLSSGYTFIGNANSLGSGTATISSTTWFGNSLTLANDIVLQIGANFFGNGFPYYANVNRDVVFSGTISGATSLNFNNFGQVTLSGSNSYGGAIYGILFSSSTSLNISSDANLGLASRTVIMNSGTLNFTGSSPVIDSTRTVNFQFGGTILNSATNLTVNGNVLGVTTINNANTASFNGTINTPSALTITGAGTTTLSGNNIMSAGTTFTGGTLITNHNNALGSTTLTFNSGTLRAGTTGINLANNITLGTTGNFSGTNDFTLSGAISGGFGISQVGSNQLTLTGANNYTGVTTINNGATLRIGAAGTTGSLGSNSVSNAGSLIFDRSNTSTVANNISGLGSLTQAGAGTTILTGSNNYSGGTTISAGSLQIGNGGATGSITGNVVNNGNLAFNLSSDFVEGNIISGTGTLTQAGSGKLTLSGLNTYSGGTTLTNGTLELGTSSQVVLGSITQGPVGLGMLTMTGGSLMATNSFAYTLDNPYTVNGAVSIAPLSGGITFNGHGTLASGTFTVNPYSTTFMYGNLSGPGNLTIATTGGGGALRIYSPDNSNYSGTTTVTTARLELMTATNALGSGLLVLNTSSGASLGTYLTTVTLNNDFSVIGAGEIVGTSALIMNGNGDLSGGSLTIAKTANVTTTFNGAISGANDLIQNSSAGTVVLAGANSYANTTMTAGTLQVGNGGTTGRLGNGTVSNNTALIFNRSDNFTVNNPISGAGSVTQSGSGITTLGSANTYTGATNIDAGSLKNGVINAIPNASALSVSATGTYDLGGFSQTLSSISSVAGATITSSSGTPILTANTGSTTTFAGNLTGTLSLTKNGVGTLILIGTNSYDATVINGGTLQIGNGGMTGTLGTGTVSNDGILDINTSALFTIPSAMTGSGSFTQSGTGTTVFTADNTYSGTTTINAGELQIGDNTTTGTLGSGNVVNNATLTFERSDDYMVDNVISGSGDLSHYGNGLLTLTGANSYDGTTYIDGSLTVTHANALGSAAGETFLSPGALLNLNNVALGAENITVNGTNIGGTLSSTGTSSMAGNLTITGGEVVVDNTGGSFSIGGTVDGNENLILNGISGITIFNGAVGSNNKIATLTANTAVAVNGGSVLTTGDQHYFSTVSVGNDAVFATDGSGIQAITFDNNLSGATHNITLSGTQTLGTPTYQFTLLGVSAANINVTATNNSVDNVLSLNTGGTQNFTITSNNTGNISGIASVTGNFNFSNIHNLNGGSGADTFRMAGGSLAGNINGGAGVNTLIGANAANTWAITANNGGSLTGIGGTFAEINDLIGGTSLDIFNFTEGFSISGMIDGGDTSNINQINFNTYATATPLTLRLGTPVLGVIDKGGVYNPLNQLIADFTRVQSSLGNNTSNIRVPTNKKITVTYYDSTKLNGEIGDPFYFYGWMIGNPPPVTPSSTPAPVFLSPYIAPIVNQPITNSGSNNNYNMANPNTNYYDINSTIINQTYTDPLLTTTNVVETGNYCYQTTN